MMASDAILEDFEAREEETTVLRERLAHLKKQHAAYTNVILAANSAQLQQPGYWCVCLSSVMRASKL